jgi:hypothetical protein
MPLSRGRSTVPSRSCALSLAPLQPDRALITHDIARREGPLWRVVLGRPDSEEKVFDSVCEARQAEPGGAFNVSTHHAPDADRGCLLPASRAMDAARDAFGMVSRSYNAAVLPGPEDDRHVYVSPATGEPDVWPLGGDARYRVSATGDRVREARGLHKGINDLKTKRPDGKTVEFEMHNHVMSSPYGRDGPRSPSTSSAGRSPMRSTRMGRSGPQGSPKSSFKPLARTSRRS